jgi:hypothetical protein
MCLSSIAKSRTVHHFGPANPSRYSTACTGPKKPSSVSSIYSPHDDFDTRYRNRHMVSLRSRYPQSLDHLHIFTTLVTQAQQHNIDHKPRPRAHPSIRQLTTGAQAMLTSRDAIQCYVPLLWTYHPPGHVIPVPCVPVGFISLLLPRTIDRFLPLAHTMLWTLSPGVLCGPE